MEGEGKPMNTTPLPAKVRTFDIEGQPVQLIDTEKIREGIIGGNVANASEEGSRQGART